MKSQSEREILEVQMENKGLDQLMENESEEIMEPVDSKNCCCHKEKQRTDKEYRDLINRLSRIEGQIRGIKGMLEKDCYCVDIMIQAAAVNAAINSFNKALMENHIRTCVTEDILNGKYDTVDELITTLRKLMK